MAHDFKKLIGDLRRHAFQCGALATGDRRDYHAEQAATDEAQSALEDAIKSILIRDAVNEHQSNMLTEKVMKTMGRRG